MARGQPDFGMYAAKTTTAGLADMAELAVRLGSIVTYDRRGEVVDFDDFEDTIVKWSQISAGEDTLVSHYHENVKSGSQALDITTDTADGDFGHIRRFRSVLASKRIGVEISISNWSANIDFFIEVSYYDGVTLHYAELKIDLTAHKLYVKDKTEGYVEIADLGLLYAFPWHWYTVKLVIDFDNDKYVRLLFADTEYDISAYTLETSGDEAAATLMVEIGCDNTSEGEGGMGLADYILTQAEP